MAQLSDQLGDVTPEEPVARCLTQSNHYNRPSDRVTERAFLPAPDKTTSVFRVDGLSEAQIWQLADTHIVNIPDGRPVYGTGTIRAQVVEDVGLRLDPDDDPPRHAAIVGWSEDKHDWKSRAQRLAASARLRLRPGV
jgi:hypothetical protein